MTYFWGASIISEAKAQKSTRGTVKIALWKPVGLPLNPFFAEQESTDYLRFLVLDPLVRLDESGSWTCVQCKEFPSIDNALIKHFSDKKTTFKQTISFELRNNIYWGDGTPITAQDAQFTWQVANTIKQDFPGKHLFRLIKKVEIDPQNRKKFTLYYERVHYFYDDFAHFFLLPKHLEYSVWKKHQKNYLKHTLYKKTPKNPGLYSGPYRFERKYSNSKVKFVANHYNCNHKLCKSSLTAYSIENYPRKPSIEIYTEPACQHLNCMDHTNENASLPLPPSTKGFKLKWGDSTHLEHIGLNLRNPNLRDSNIRKALAHAIDKEALLKFTKKEAIPSSSIMTPSNPHFNNKTVYYEFNPSISIKILDEQGWKLKKNIRQKNGRLLSFSLLTNLDPERIAIAKFLIASWGEIGIKVSHVALRNRIFREKLSRMNYDSMTLFAWDLPMKSTFRTIFHSQVIPSIRNNYQGQNIYGLNNHSLNQALNKLDILFDPAKRFQQDIKVQQILGEQVPIIPLYFKLKKAMVHPHYNGLKVYHHQYPSSLNVKEWLKSPHNIPTS